MNKDMKKQTGFQVNDICTYPKELKQTIWKFIYHYCTTKKKIPISIVRTIITLNEDVPDKLIASNEYKQFVYFLGVLANFVDDCGTIDGVNSFDNLPEETKKITSDLLLENSAKGGSMYMASIRTVFNILASQEVKSTDFLGVDWCRDCFALMRDFSEVIESVPEEGHTKREL